MKMEGRLGRLVLLSVVFAMGGACSDGEKERAEMEAMREELTAMREMILAQQELGASGEAIPSAGVRDARGGGPLGMPGAGAPGMPAGGASGVPGAGMPGGRVMPGAGVGAPSGVGGIPESVGVDFSKLPGGFSEGDWYLERAREEVAYWDRDGDGALSKEEYLAKYVERHERRFDGLDVDGDGVLTAEEVGEVAPPAPPGAANGE